MQTVQGLNAAQYSCTLNTEAKTVPKYSPSKVINCHSFGLKFIKTSMCKFRPLKNCPPKPIPLKWVRPSIRLVQHGTHQANQYLQDCKVANKATRTRFIEPFVDCPIWHVGVTAWQVTRCTVFPHKTAEVEHLFSILPHSKENYKILPEIAREGIFPPY